MPYCFVPWQFSVSLVPYLGLGDRAWEDPSHVYIHKKILAQSPNLRNSKEK